MIDFNLLESSAVDNFDTSFSCFDALLRSYVETYAGFLSVLPTGDLGLVSLAFEVSLRIGDGAN